MTVGVWGCTAQPRGSPAGMSHLHSPVSCCPGWHDPKPITGGDQPRVPRSGAGCQQMALFLLRWELLVPSTALSWTRGSSGLRARRFAEPHSAALGASGDAELTASLPMETCPPGGSFPSGSVPDSDSVTTSTNHHTACFVSALVF